MKSSSKLKSSLKGKAATAGAIQPSPPPVEAVQETKTLTTRRREWREVGYHLASVMGDPNTPAAIYDGIAEAIFEMVNKSDITWVHPVLLRTVYPLLAEIDETGKMSVGPLLETEAEFYARLASTISEALERTSVPRKVKAALTKFYVDLSGEVVGNNECQAIEIRSTLPALCLALSSKKGGYSDEE